MKIVFTGEETTQVLGKAQVVKKYRNGDSELRVTPQGLVVSLSYGPAFGFAMSGYKEYERWGPTR